MQAPLPRHTFPPRHSSSSSSRLPSAPRDDPSLLAASLLSHEDEDFDSDNHHRYSCDAWLHFDHNNYADSELPAHPARFSFSTDVCGSPHVNSAAAAAAAKVNGASASAGSPARLSAASSCKESVSPPASEFEFSMADSTFDSIEPTCSTSDTARYPGHTEASRPPRERRRQCLAAADELFCDGKLLPLYYSGYNYTNYFTIGGGGGGGGVADLQAPVRRRSNAGETTYDYYYAHGAVADALDTNHHYNRRPAPAPADHPISPKAPTCTSRWKELLGLQKKGGAAQIASDQSDSAAMRARSASSSSSSGSSWNKAAMRSSDVGVNHYHHHPHRIHAPPPPLVPGRRSLDSCNAAATTTGNSSSCTTSLRGGLQKLAAFQRHSCTERVEYAAATLAQQPPCDHYNYHHFPTAAADSVSSSTIAHQSSSDPPLDRFGADQHRVQARLMSSNPSTSEPPPPAAADTLKQNWTAKASECGSRGDYGQCRTANSEESARAGSSSSSISRRSSSWMKHYTRGLVNMRSASPPPAAAGRPRGGREMTKAAATLADHDDSAAAAAAAATECSSSCGGGGAPEKQQQQQQAAGYGYGGSCRGNSSRASLRRSYSGPLRPTNALRIKQQQQQQQQLGGSGAAAAAARVAWGRQGRIGAAEVGLGTNSGGVGGGIGGRRAALERSSSYSGAGMRVTPVIHVPLYMIRRGQIRSKLSGGGGGGGGSKKAAAAPGPAAPAASGGGRSILGGLAQTVFSSSSRIS